MKNFQSSSLNFIASVEQIVKSIAAARALLIHHKNKNYDISSSGTREGSFVYVWEESGNAAKGSENV